MEANNKTMVAYFVISGISNIPHLQVPIFLLVLLIYLNTLGGNMTILLLVFLDSHLHTPMYFFLANLSILDMSSSSITLHKVLAAFITRDKTVSFLGCIVQFYMFSSLACNQLLILTAMSFDRYVAICSPLRYSIIMNSRVCALLATVCWVLSFLEVVPYLVLLLEFTCYKSNIINHFFCDLVPLLSLTCSDTSALEMLSLIEGLLLLSLTPFVLTFTPYVFIITAIVRIRTSSGRYKAFYTCSSHLITVVLLYGTLVSQYLKPTTEDSLESNKLFSLFNTAAVPMLNPLIYSLNNKDVKAALKRTLRAIKY
ncbi:PREDICTED: olfactory receptor 6C3-like [Nanorana parkeri]|uniref:olfactory receptor 6C3-like n=1 Tax=Nanorana parkeri TaxID=125878 RepID=UPI0008549A5D|nr:PREDICTED: olfactory receptor 6C3-like [Nanorana parkeri]